jgi:NAD(P)-dependent dehydrogenase (short-subunit alcohol dehydrogenase family)
MAAYCSSKSGLNALMEAIRVEVDSFGIATTIICPGWVRTPMTSHLNLPMPNMLDVGEAAKRILAAIRLRKKFVAYPPQTAWQVRVLQWLPAALSDWVVHQLMKRLEKHQPRL